MQIGKGRWGTVYKAKDKKTGQLLALKIVATVENDIQVGIPKSLLREISFLKHLKHQNIVRLFDVIHTNASVVLVMEYLDQDLKKYMEAFPEGLSTSKTKSLMFQLLSAVNFCHLRRILHRDIKPQNILINSNEEVRLADFGLARSFGLPVSEYSAEVVSLSYRPPELFFGCTQYSVGVDMWGIGCLFAEMSNGAQLFAGASHTEEMIPLIFSTLSTPTLASWPSLRELPQFDQYQSFVTPPETLKTVCWRSLAPKLDSFGLDLLSRFLRYEPVSRIASDNALQHPFFYHMGESESHNHADSFAATKR